MQFPAVPPIRSSDQSSNAEGGTATIELPAPPVRKPMPGWAVLLPVSGRAVYRGVAEMSLYIAAAHRGRRVGDALMAPYELLGSSGYGGDEGRIPGIDVAVANWRLAVADSSSDRSVT